MKMLVALFQRAFRFVKDREYALFIALVATTLMEIEAVLDVISLELGDVEFGDWRSLVPIGVGLLIRFGVFSADTKDTLVNAAEVNGYLRGVGVGTLAAELGRRQELANGELVDDEAPRPNED